MAVQVATAAAVCTPSKRATFKCTQTVGGTILDWKPIPGGVQMAVSAPGNVWVGLMVPDIPGKMSTNDPKETPALDSPRPSFAAIGSVYTSGAPFSVRSASSWSSSYGPFRTSAPLRFLCLLFRAERLHTLENDGSACITTAGCIVHGDFVAVPMKSECWNLGVRLCAVRRTGHFRAPACAVRTRLPGTAVREAILFLVWIWRASSSQGLSSCLSTEYKTMYTIYGNSYWLQPRLWLASLIGIFASAVCHHEWRSRSQHGIDSHAACKKCTTIDGARWSSVEALCADRQGRQQKFHCQVQLERRLRWSSERWRQVSEVISNILVYIIFVNQFHLEWLLMCVALVSLVYLSLLSLLYESLPPQLPELSETPRQLEDQRTGARGACVRARRAGMSCRDHKACLAWCVSVRPTLRSSGF